MKYLAKIMDKLLKYKIKVETDIFPTPTISKWYYCWCSGHKVFRVSNMATGSSCPKEKQP